MKLQLSVSLVLIGTLCGCAGSRGFNRGLLRQELGGAAAAVTDADIGNVLAIKPQLPRPFKLGVYFKDPEERLGYRAPGWHWSDEDKSRVFAAWDKLQTAGEISSAFVISDAATTGTDLRSLRLAAARHGADALLVVSGATDLDSYNNGWSWTYVALVTALFVPGSEEEVLFMARAALWDVRNEFLYLTAESESTKNQTRPAAFTDSHRITAEAKDEAVGKLCAEIARSANSNGTAIKR